MKRGFQYISDLHLDRLGRNKIPTIKKTSDTLLICGDLGNPFKNNYKEFLHYSSNEFNNVFLISGNHEYYHKDMKKVLDVDNKIQDISNKFSNVEFLNQTCSNFEHNKIFGTTLWADGFKYWEQENNHHLREFGKFVHNKHKNDVRWLRNNIHSKINVNKNLIIMTHYLPSYQLITPKFKEFDNLDRFATNIEYLMKPPVKYWLCGHSHCKYETDINGVMCGINSFTI